MAVKQLFHVPVLLVLCQMLYGAVGQECTPEKVETSILGMMLRLHIYKRITGVEYGHVCLLDCYQDVRCQSFNYVISQYMCELNNRTKEARPEDYVPDSDRYYFGREMNRVPLGSISELPAETCKEIKASEGGEAVSGKYWFHSIIPGEAVLAYCDMKKEDVNECSASISVCDINANCKNTRGSYRCSCKAGFSGDGNTCADIDECRAFVPVCDVNANCQNTVGSHVCSCKGGFTGDGKTCTDIDECSAAIRVCDVNSNCQNNGGSYVCSCKAGFTGDGKTCADVDECSASVPVCDVNANCRNTVGSHVCSCKAGFTGNGKTCVDIDECSASVRVCDVNANCQNTVGSHVCSCKAGFTGDGKNCTDIDECRASIRVCDVNANCQNTGGSYVCSCKAGFTGDGKICNIKCSPVGISSPGIIPDNQMTASSECSGSYKAYYGRLNGTRGDGWCSKIRDSKNDWLQIDFGKVIYVCGVATQGDRNGNEYTTDFELSFSADGSSWTPYKDDNNVKVEFHREGNSNSIDQHKLPTFVSARYIRFHPIKRHNWNCLRVEVYGTVKDCAELYKSGQQNSSVYTINPDGLGEFDVFCDQTAVGGGWTVFQKRQDGSVDFYRNWADYKQGFGKLNGEFWLGLDKIHRLTNSGNYKLRVDLEDFTGNTAYAEYGSFGVADEGNKYQLSVGSYSGSAGDSLAYHNGYPFTTKDQDNDYWSSNCAVQYKGAWWYRHCYSSNLNGIYYQGHYTGSDSANWYHWKTNHDSLKRSEMKMRPVNF